MVTAGDNHGFGGADPRAAAGAPREVAARQSAGAPREVRLHASWRRWLDAEFGQAYMQQLRAFLRAQLQQRKVIYPQGTDIFAALDLTPFDAVRVVIIGQDPYHGAGQAHGLCFSVLPGVQAPPSLQNIFAEIDADMAAGRPGGAAVRGRPGAGHGCLSSWARQGVLLLNAVLTVEQGRAGSHQGKGWETFTDQVVRVLNEERDGLVFLLWGAYAQRKGAIVDARRHLVLTAPHPSPLSAHKGFLGCRHFSQTNRYLVERGLEPIDWFAVE